MKLSFNIGLLALRIMATGITLLPMLCGHDPGMSTATAIVRDDSLKLRISLPIEDDATLNRSGLSGLGLRQGLMQLEVDGAIVEPASTRSNRRSGEVHYDIEYKFESRPADVALRSIAFANLPAGHLQFVSVRAADGESLTSCLLSRDTNSCRVSLLPTTADSGYTKFRRAIWVLLAGCALLALRFKGSQLAVALRATTILVLAAVAVAPSPAEHQTLAGEEVPALAAGLEPLQFSVVVSSTPLDSKIHLRDPKRFRDTLFSRDDQLFTLLDGVRRCVEIVSIRSKILHTDNPQHKLRRRSHEGAERLLPKHRAAHLSRPGAALHRERHDHREKHQRLDRRPPSASDQPLPARRLEPLNPGPGTHACGPLFVPANQPGPGTITERGQPIQPPLLGNPELLRIKIERLLARRAHSWHPRLRTHHHRRIDLSPRREMSIRGANAG